MEYFKGIKWDRLGQDDGTPVPIEIKCSMRDTAVFNELSLEPHSSLLFQQF
jgi:hypothetical protein